MTPQDQYMKLCSTTKFDQKMTTRLQLATIPKKEILAVVRLHVHINSELICNSELNCTSIECAKELKKKSVEMIVWASSMNPPHRSAAVKVE